MADSVDTLAQATGIPRAELLQLWEDAKANERRLSGCPRHVFTPVNTATFAQKYVCRVCSGVVDAHAHHWYALGLQHGVATDG